MNAREEVARHVALAISNFPSKELIKAICLVSEHIIACAHELETTKSRRATRKQLEELRANATLV